MMKILAISDDDSLVCQLKDTKPDVLLALGDLLDSTIEKAVAYYRPRVAFGVRGNHDFDALFPAGVIDLHCHFHKFEGVRFGGFGGSWKYKPRGHHLYEQAEVSAILRGFPVVDVFVSHNSPEGVHERDRETHQGFKAFNDYIARCRPDCLIHGHQHLDAVTELDGTKVIGVFGERLITIEKSGG